MRTILGLAALAILAGAAPAAQAQQYAAPAGSYQQRCKDIRMEGSILSATCGGVRGGAQSSINILSCASVISVDATGGLSCTGPGVARPPGGGYGPGPRPPEPGYRPPSGGYGRDSLVVFGKRNYRGASARLDRGTSNLSDTGLNDRIRSIQLDRRSGPWLICTDANFKGRCMTIRDSVADTRQIGMGDAISSLRPLR
jgi:hypothetical protein